MTHPLPCFHLRSCPSTWNSRKIFGDQIRMETRRIYIKTSLCGASQRARKFGTSFARCSLLALSRLWRSYDVGVSLVYRYTTASYHIMKTIKTLHSTYISSQWVSSSHFLNLLISVDLLPHYLLINFRCFILSLYVHHNKNLHFFYPSYRV